MEARPLGTGALRRLERVVLSRPAAVACLVGLWGWVVLGQPMRSLLMFPDASRYLELGRSLAAGEGYRIEGQFWRSYPPVFPLMLSAVSSPTRTQFLPERLLVALSALGGVLGFYWLLSQRYGGWRRFGLGVLTVVAPALVYMATSPLSDAPFFLFTGLFLAAASQYWRLPKPSWPLAALSALALMLAVMTRSAGLAFLVAWAIWLARPSLWREQRRRALLFAAAFVLLACLPVAGWKLFVRFYRPEGTRTYSQVLAGHVLEGHPLLSPEGLRALVAREAWIVPLELRTAGFALLTVNNRSNWMLLIDLVVLAGLVHRLRKRELPEWCFCGYALLVTFWPAYQGVRYWLPVLPLMLGYLVDGTDRLGGLASAQSRLSRWGPLRRLDAAAGRARPMLLCGGAAVIFWLSVSSDVRMGERNWDRDAEAIQNVVLQRDRRDVAKFLVARGSKPTTLACLPYLEVRPALRNLPVRVVGVPFEPSSDVQSSLDALSKLGATHIAFESNIAEFSETRDWTEAIASLVDQAPHRFRLARATRYVLIYEILPPLPEALSPAGS